MLLTSTSDFMFCFIGIVRHVKPLRTSSRQGRIRKSGHPSLFMAEAPSFGGINHTYLIKINASSSERKERAVRIQHPSLPPFRVDVSNERLVQGCFYGRTPLSFLRIIFIFRRNHKINLSKFSPILKAILSTKWECLSWMLSI